MHVLGPVRGRYFLATQQKIGAEAALRLGVVREAGHGLALQGLSCAALGNPQEEPHRP